MSEPRVLVVDDAQWWVESLERTLRPQGFIVSSVPHGLAAIDQVDRERPDIIVLDLFLPGPNGLALVHELRSHDDLAAIPIVVVSGAVSPEVAEALTRYGITHSLDKAAVTPEKIAAALRKALL